MKNIYVKYKNKLAPTYAEWPHLDNYITKEKRKLLLVIIKAVLTDGANAN